MFVSSSGGHCPFYDVEESSVELNLYQSCKEYTTPCPDFYNSSVSYRCKYALFFKISLYDNLYCQITFKLDCHDRLFKKKTLIYFDTFMNNHYRFNGFFSVHAGTHGKCSTSELKANLTCCLVKTYMYQ